MVERPTRMTPPWLATNKPFTLLEMSQLRTVAVAGELAPDGTTEIPALLFARPQSLNESEDVVPAALERKTPGPSLSSIHTWLSAPVRRPDADGGGAA